MNKLTYSDARYAGEISKIESALSKLRQIRGAMFNQLDVWGQPRRAGILAQDVKGVLPEAVEEDPTGLLSLSYDSVVALLVEAVKELSDEVTRLKAERRSK